MAKFLVLFTVFIFFLFTHNSQAQVKPRLALSGKITDAKTGEALAGATVSINDARIGAIADSSGN